MKAQAQPRRIVLGREGKKYLLIMYSFFFFFFAFSRNCCSITIMIELYYPLIIRSWKIIVIYNLQNW